MRWRARGVLRLPNRRMACGPDAGPRSQKALSVPPAMSMVFDQPESMENGHRAGGFTLDMMHWRHSKMLKKPGISLTRLIEGLAALPIWRLSVIRMKGWKPAFARHTTYTTTAGGWRNGLTSPKPNPSPRPPW